MSKVSDAVKATGGAVDAVIDVLPASWAVKVRAARKTVVAFASVATPVAVFLPDRWEGWAVAVATAIVTYWTPNA